MNVSADFVGAFLTASAIALGLTLAAAYLVWFARRCWTKAPAIGEGR